MLHIVPVQSGQTCRDVGFSPWHAMPSWRILSHLAGCAYCKRVPDSVQLRKHRSLDMALDRSCCPMELPADEHDGFLSSRTARAVFSLDDCGDLPSRHLGTSCATTPAQTTWHAQRARLVVLLGVIVTTCRGRRQRR